MTDLHSRIIRSGKMLLCNSIHCAGQRGQNAAFAEIATIKRTVTVAVK